MVSANIKQFSDGWYAYIFSHSLSLSEWKQQSTLSYLYRVFFSAENRLKLLWHDINTLFTRNSSFYSPYVRKYLTEELNSEDAMWHIQKIETNLLVLFHSSCRMCILYCIRMHFAGRLQVRQFKCGAAVISRPPTWALFIATYIY